MSDCYLTLEEVKLNTSYLDGSIYKTYITHFFSYKESICQPPKKTITKIQYKSNKMNKDCYPYMEKEQKEYEQYSM